MLNVYEIAQRFFLLYLSKPAIDQASRIVLRDFLKISFALRAAILIQWQKPPEAIETKTFRRRHLAAQTAF
jgi:hypothetical protein